MGRGQVDEDDDEEDEEREVQLLRGQRYCRCPRQLTLQIGQTYVPLAMNTNVAKMVAFETGFRITQVILVKRAIYWYSMYSPGS